MTHLTVNLDDLYQPIRSTSPRKMNSLPEKATMECGNCSFKDRWLLHYVRFRGEYRRLCPSCVLKLHPGSFCSVCLNLIEASVPPYGRMTCQKCPSITHSSCVSSLDKPYTCPPCINPSFRFFDVKRNGEGQFEIDLKSANALLCAARIAAESMGRAVQMAEADALRKAKEAVASRKRAIEGLEEICAREKARKLGQDSSFGRSASRMDHNYRVGSSNMDRMVVGGSVSVPGGLTNFGSQNRSSHWRMISATGNSQIMQRDDQRGKIRSNGEAGKISPVVNSVSASPMNVDDAGITSHGNGRLGLSSSRPAEHGQ